MFISCLKKIIFAILKKIYGNTKIENLSFVINNLRPNDLFSNRDVCINSNISNKAHLYSKFVLFNSEIGDYTYIAENSTIRLTTIGKFCSVGANFVCGWGIHPTDGISTSPMFYSTQKQNGTSLSETDKIQETLPIIIGNDVFIGMNVTILDGITIGNGAIIGAGSVVSKDIPPYAIAVGCPIRIIKYRFSESVIRDLLDIEWWNWSQDKLSKVEKYFFDVDTFIKNSK